VRHAWVSAVPSCRQVWNKLLSLHVILGRIAKAVDLFVKGCMLLKYDYQLEICYVHTTINVLQQYKDGYEKKNAILLFEKNIEHRKTRHLASYMAFEITTIIQLSDNG
jgi:hypothetical protein